jgi:hypothetical protein
MHNPTPLAVETRRLVEQLRLVLGSARNSAIPMLRA